jgi:hypothetical protein
MGDYHDFVFGGMLKKDAPKEVLDILRWIVGDSDIHRDFPTLPNHEFFEREHWTSIGSKTFNYTAFTESVSPNTFKKFYESWQFVIRSSLKNGHDIRRFVDWIAP